MMENIKTFDQYTQLQQEFRKQARPKFMNNFLMKPEIEQLIAEGKLFHLESDEALMFLVEEKGAYQLYFSSATENLNVPMLDLPVHLDYVSRRERAAEVPVVKHLLASGFEVIAENQEYIWKSQAVEQPTDETLEFLLADEADLVEIREIWAASLDEDVNPVPTLAEMKRDLEFIYVLKREAEILAAVHLDTSGRAMLIEHFAVSPNHRRQGLGQTLLQHILVYAEKNEKVVTLWVDQTNIKAVHLYEKYGFKMTNKNSTQLKKGE